jgi:hypothetical protein
MIEVLNWQKYWIWSLLYLFILIVVFLIINVLHFRLLPPSIVLHAMLIDITLTILFVGLLFKSIYFLTFNTFLLTNTGIIFILLAMLYSALGPTMSDRSLSVFLLIKVKEANEYHQSITVNDLVHLSNLQYVNGSAMVEKRLFEQEASGALKIKDGSVMLTSSGKHVAQLFEFFNWMLGIQKK